MFERSEKISGGGLWIYLLPPPTRLTLFADLPTRGR